MKGPYYAAIVLFGFVQVSAAAPSGPREQAAAIFSAIKTALEKKKEDAFRHHWDPSGYKDNLVGGSGLSGQAVFQQGSRKGWFLKPELNSLRAIYRNPGSPMIVRCDIWSRAKRKKVDRVFAVLVQTREKHARRVLLGAGEKEKEVLALAHRWVKGNKLKP